LFPWQVPQRRAADYDASLKDEPALASPSGGYTGGPAVTAEQGLTQKRLHHGHGAREQTLKLRAV